MASIHEKPWYQVLAVAIGCFLLWIAAIAAIMLVFETIVRTYQ